MDILFLGGIINDSEIIRKSNGNISNAANALQWNIIKGLDENIGKPISILNAVFVGSYPNKYKDALIKTYRWSHIEGARDKNVGFINIDGIKHLSRVKRIAKEIEEWANDNKSDKYIVAYSIHTPFLFAIKRAKEINPNIKACLIVPDLPQYMNLSKNVGKLYHILKKIDFKAISGLLRYVDKYVLLTKHMADFLKVNEDDYIVIEGMVNENELIKEEVMNTDTSDIKKILYTGTLRYKYGISTLLKAFSLIPNENYRLQICGSGEAEKEIIELTKHDNRIEYFGVTSRNEALKLQRDSTVLINPRNSEGEYTKYSFPSKNMEYLLSGRPTIAYKLPGIPEEYNDYIYFIEDESAHCMAERIKQICEKEPSELDLFGERAQKFVIDQKNNLKQSKRIIEMLGNKEDF